MTPSGIEPATFRSVAQYLNHCATISGPPIFEYNGINFCVSTEFIAITTAQRHDGVDCIDIMDVMVRLVAVILGYSRYDIRLLYYNACFFDCWIRIEVRLKWTLETGN
jgi:hypothetical protein